MRSVKSHLRQGNVMPILLGATAILGLLAAVGASTDSWTTQHDVRMTIEPNEKTVLVGDTFDIEIVVQSAIPVNVFAGEVKFDQDILRIESIDYNTSIADLWAERPWYSNGEGTLNFGGGTTEKAGFVGSDRLIRATFTTLRAGEGIIFIHEPRILLHDGLGTDAPLGTTTDAVFIVENASPGENNLIAATDISTQYKVSQQPPTTDLNSDGKQSLADISIFMLNMLSNDEHFDFNLDGKVNTKDLNILLGR